MVLIIDNWFYFHKAYEGEILPLIDHCGSVEQEGNWLNVVNLFLFAAFKILLKDWKEMVKVKSKCIEIVLLKMK